LSEYRSVLVLQTAFIGDVILTLPLIQAVRTLYPQAAIDVVVIPKSGEIFQNHPDVREVIFFDKKGVDRGLKGLRRIAGRLKARSYDLALVPHRSLRSAILPLLAGIPVRVGFNRGLGQVLHTSRTTYRKDKHEIDRNLDLLTQVVTSTVPRQLPRVCPSEIDVKRIDRLLIELEVGAPGRMIAIAPGTIWNTKRWLKERFASLAVNLDDAGYEVVLIGGQDDYGLCAEIRTLSGSSRVHSVAGILTLLQSAELIRRCALLICNDSAPMHLAASVGTPVAAIFGATIPSFGFGPSGPADTVIETTGLKCRPCSIHGGDKCPINTFDCMVDISYERVFRTAMEIIRRTSKTPPTEKTI
jgi:heptosyltransferase-2